MSDCRRKVVPVTENDVFVTLRALINRGYCDIPGILERSGLSQDVVEECLYLATEQKMCLKWRYSEDYLLTPFGQQTVELDSLRRLAALSREGDAALWD